MNNKTVFGLVGMCTVVIIVLGIMLTIKTQPAQLDQSALASVEVMDSTAHDWGEIDINGGKVARNFTITNTGDSELIINNLKTSCMCTEAQITINGSPSPMFGMHTRSGWSGVVKPGEIADINVIFDPLFHGPEGTGPITRLVSFSTNDANNPIVEFRLTAEVVKL